MTASEIEAGASDWESRALCPDDSCIGVLDAQGRCSTCGRQGEAPAERPARDPALDSLDDLDADGADVTAGAVDSSSGEEGGVEFGDRELCPDESCIGVLDDAGACKVCGKRQA